jgi:hypothetical protein
MDIAARQMGLLECCTRFMVRNVPWLPDLVTLSSIASKRAERLYDSVRILNHSSLSLIPVVLIPGRETCNANHVVSGNTGAFARGPIEVLKTMCHWCEKDQCLYHQQAQNARQLVHPRAAFDVADLAWAPASS